jgi:hypothetical protein
VPAATKLQEEYGDDIQVIFVECQGATREQFEAFAWSMKWMGNNAMWTEERPFATVGGGLPETALIGIYGRIIMQGHPGSYGKKLEAAIEAEIKKSKLFRSSRRRSMPEPSGPPASVPGPGPGARRAFRRRAARSIERRRRAGHWSSA